MGQIKTLSADDLLRVTGVWGRQFQTVQWHSARLVVRHSLEIRDYIDLIRRIVRDCRPENGNAAFELFDFAARLNTVQFYAFVELPEDIERTFHILYDSDLFETVRKYANTQQIDAAREAAFIMLNGRTAKEGEHGLQKPA